MSKLNKNELIEKINAVINAASCCPELKESGKNLLNALNTKDEKTALLSFYKELEEDVGTIDSIIAFSASESGEKIFGKETAKAVNKAAIEAKSKGETYCICEACQAGKALLLIKDEVVNN